MALRRILLRKKAKLVISRIALMEKAGKRSRMGFNRHRQISARQEKVEVNDAQENGALRALGKAEGTQIGDGRRGGEN